MVCACVEMRRRIVQWRLLIRNIDPTYNFYKWEMMPKSKKKNIIVPYHTYNNAIHNA